MVQELIKATEEQTLEFLVSETGLSFNEVRAKLDDPTSIDEMVGYVIDAIVREVTIYEADPENNSKDRIFLAENVSLYLDGLR